jgi:glucoamylase
MAALSGAGGMLPEQVWDTDAIPERGLYPGRPSGSAMPLAWAHAEFIKLACSLLEGQPVDRPEPLWARYHGQRPQAHVWFWTSQSPLQHIPVGVQPGICLSEPTALQWQYEGQAVQTCMTESLPVGLHLARLPAPPATASYLELELRQTGGHTLKSRVSVVRPDE